MAVNKAKQESFVNFGDFGAYVAGGGLPEGDYALEFMLQNYQAESKEGVKKGPVRLGVMVTAHNLNDLSEEPRKQFYSLGSKAHESYAPDPETGKRLVLVPGGPGASSFYNSTNWAYLLKSMVECGLPSGVFTNDISVLDGIHVHMHNIPEPEDRKGFQKSKTSEVEEEPRKAGTIAVVSEIKEDGKPWEGSGGIPEREEKKAAAKPAGKAAPAAGKVAPKVAPKAAPKAAPAEEATGLSEEELHDLAISAVSSVLEKSPDGLMKVLMRTNTFKAISKEQGDEAAQQVIDTYMADDETWGALLGELGYALKGPKVVVAEE